VPKSKVRKKPSSTTQVAAAGGPTTAAKQTRPSPSWYPIAMSVLLVLGLAYIVVYYVAGEHIPFMNDLGSWNFAVGFAFLLVGLLMAVRWR
jgi:Cell division protein CrgA